MVRNRSGMAQDDTRDGDAAKVPELRWLRVLVTVLAGAMVLGVTAIAAILWLRLSEPPLPALPAGIALPAGASPAAVTFALQAREASLSLWQGSNEGEHAIHNPGHIENSAGICMKRKKSK